MIGLFHKEQHDKLRDELISDVFLWYESTRPPRFVPSQATAADEVGAGVAGSILCHVSVSEWCKSTGRDAFGAERRERCRRLSADCAMRVVELLNAGADGPADFLDVTDATHACIECHGKGGRGDSSTRMTCVRCHQFERTHP